MGQVAAAQNASTKGGDELLKPEPGSWNTWQFNLMNLFSPYPQLKYHIENEAELPNRPRTKGTDKDEAAFEAEHLERKETVRTEKSMLLTIIALKVHPVMALASVKPRPMTPKALYDYLKSQASKSDQTFIEMIRQKLRNHRLPRNQIELNKFLAEFQSMIAQLADADSALSDSEQIAHLHSAMGANDGDENGNNGLWTQIIHTQRHTANVTLPSAIAEFKTQALLYKQRRGLKQTLPEQGFYADQSRNKSSTSTKKCAFCHRNNHSVEECRTMLKYGEKYRDERQEKKTKKKKDKRESKKDEDNDSVCLAEFETGLIKEMGYLASTEQGDESDGTNSSCFIMDSGATITMVNNKDWLSNTVDIDEPLNIFKRNGGVRAKAKGTVTIRVDNSYGHVNQISLTAIYIPEAPANLISLPQLDATGYKAAIGNSKCVVRRMSFGAVH